MSPRRTAQPDEEQFYRVRVVVPGALLHLACRTEPRLIRDSLGRLQSVEAAWINGEPDKGDTIGLIRWSEVTAITWRWSGERQPQPIDLFEPVRRRAAVPPWMLPDDWPAA